MKITEEIGADLITTMRHARVFITSREKMHPTGVELYDALLASLTSALGDARAQEAGDAVPAAYRYRMKDNPDMDWRYSAVDMSSKSYVCEPLYASPVPPAAGLALDSVRNEIADILGKIEGLCSALRSGGPDPMDLQGLSDALSEACDLATEAGNLLSRPAAAGDVAAETIERCAQVADEYATPNRFSVSDQWKEHTPAQVYDAAATDVGGWIANEIRALTSTKGGSVSRQNGETATGGA